MTPKCDKCGEEADIYNYNIFSFCKSCADKVDELLESFIYNRKEEDDD